VCKYKQGVLLLLLLLVLLLLVGWASGLGKGGVDGHVSDESGSAA
jgi:hypothetical protein